MIDVEVSIVPIGTSSTSISDFVAESEKVLVRYPEFDYRINGIGTEIEANNIDEVFNLIKEMHQAQINKGAQRLQTSIRIDDRRDKESNVNEKITSLVSKM